MKKVLIIYFIAVMVRFFIALQQHPLFDLSSDDYYYYLNSKSFFYYRDFLHYRGNTETDNIGYFTGPNYLYQMLMSFTFIFHNPLIAAKLFNSLLINSIIFPIYDIMKDYNQKKDAALFSSAVLFFPQFNIIGFWITEILALPLIVFFIWVTYRVKKIYHVIVIIPLFILLIFYTRPQYLTIIVAFFLALFSLILIRKLKLGTKTTNLTYSLVFLLSFVLLRYAAIFLYDLFFLKYEYLWGYYAGHAHGILNFSFEKLEPNFFQSYLTWFIDNISVIATIIFFPLLFILLYGFKIFKNQKVYGRNLLWLTVMIHSFIILLMNVVLNYGRMPRSLGDITQYMYYSRYFLITLVTIFFISFTVISKNREKRFYILFPLFALALYLFYNNFFVMNPDYSQRSFFMAGICSIEISFFLTFIKHYPYQIFSLIVAMLFIYSQVASNKKSLVYTKRIYAYGFILFWIINQYAFSINYKKLSEIDSTYGGFPNGKGYQEGQKPAKAEWLDNNK